MVSRVVDLCLKFATFDVGLDYQNKIEPKLGLGFWNNQDLVLIAGSFG